MRRTNLLVFVSKVHLPLVGYSIDDVVFGEEDLFLLKWRFWTNRSSREPNFGIFIVLTFPSFSEGRPGIGVAK